MENKVPSYDVLLVDDETAICDILGELVSMHGYQFKQAHDADTAFGILSVEAPPLVICDISMPGKNGLELLELIKKNGMHSAVVMLTAHAESEKVIQALQLGAIDYMTKPFDPSMFLEKITSWIEIGNRLKSLHVPIIPTHPIDISQQLRMIELFRIKNKKVG